MSQTVLRDNKGNLAIYMAIEHAMQDATDPALKATRRPSGLSPSAGSAVVRDPVSGMTVVVGKCLRQAWYKVMGFTPEPRPPDSRNYRIRNLGNIISDEFVTEALKKAGIYQADELSFYDPENLLSGRLDHMTLIPGTLERAIVETKSMSPYMEYPFIKTGRGFAFTEPRYSDLPQVMSYMQWWSQFGVKYGSLYYCTRDMVTNMFCFEWVNFGDGNRPQDGAYLKCHSSERTWDLPWLTWGQIKNRYLELREHLKDRTIPPRDFQLRWTNQHALMLTQWAGKGSQLVSISNTLSKQIQTRFRVEERKHGAGNTEKHAPYVDKGDFGCAFCDFKKRCWSGMDEGTTPEVSQEQFQVSKPQVPVTDKKPVVRKSGGMM